MAAEGRNKKHKQFTDDEIKEIEKQEVEEYDKFAYRKRTRRDIVKKLKQDNDIKSNQVQNSSERILSLRSGIVSICSRPSLVRGRRRKSSLLPPSEQAQKKDTKSDEDSHFDDKTVVLLKKEEHQKKKLKKVVKDNKKIVTKAEERQQLVDSYNRIEEEISSRSDDLEKIENEREEWRNIMKEHEDRVADTEQIAVSNEEIPALPLLHEENTIALLSADQQEFLNNRIDTASLLQRMQDKLNRSIINVKSIHTTIAQLGLLKCAMATFLEEKSQQIELSSLTKGTPRRLIKKILQ